MREKFRPKTAQDENSSCFDCGDASTEQLERARIDPVSIREFNDHRPHERKFKNLSNQRGDREIPLPLWRQIL